MNTGIELIESDWNENAQQVKKSNHFSHELNNRLKIFMNEVQQLEIELLRDKKIITASIIADTLKNKLHNHNQNPTIAEFLETELQGRKFHDWRNLKSTIHVCLTHFGQNAKFHDITAKELTHFVKLQLSKGKSPETVKKYLNKLKTVFRKAEKAGIISPTENLFNGKSLDLPIPKGKITKDIKLELEEIRLLISYLETTESELEKQSLTIFLFQIYCQGMRIGDALKLKINNVKGNRLIYSANKTGKFFEIDLSEKEINLIEPFLKGKKKDEYLFPIMRNLSGQNKEINVMAKTALINKTLKRIALNAGIEPDKAKQISTHAARHTFAYLISESAPLHYVQSMLGHSDIQQTRDYIGSLRPDKMDQFKKDVFDKL
jgi:integrase